MKIEIDTKHDTKEELTHLANMLHAISGSEGSNTYPSRLRKKIQRAKNIFEDDSPSVGSPNPSTAPIQNQAATSGGLFGIFGNPNNEKSSLPKQPIIQEPVVNNTQADTFSIFGNTNADDNKDEDEPRPTLVPY